MNTREVFSSQLAAWGIDLPAGAVDRMHEFARLLGSYDRANVVGARDPDRVFLEHVLDSLSCLLFPEMRGAATVADVGSGGGLPGIPLAMALPEVRFTLLESTGKKASFLQRATEEFGLSNVEVANVRVEEVGRDPASRDAQDICTARAVAKLSVLAEYCIPLLKEGGHVVAMKGHVSEAEYEQGQRAARLLGGDLLRTIPVPIIGELEQKARQIIVLTKMGGTPDLYPRRVGVPAKNPLGRP